MRKSSQVDVYEKIEKEAKLEEVGEGERGR